MMLNYRKLSNQRASGRRFRVLDERTIVVMDFAVLARTPPRSDGSTILRGLNVSCSPWWVINEPTRRRAIALRYSDDC